MSENRANTTPNTLMGDANQISFFEPAIDSMLIDSRIDNSRIADESLELYVRNQKD